MKKVKSLLVHNIYHHFYSFLHSLSLILPLFSL
uniref:Uncharacterized protein n=1 Tax=Anguilla anguilla TaxID=7936 RepID=A0A0E9SRY4_ANGAN